MRIFGPGVQNDLDKTHVAPRAPLDPPLRFRSLAVVIEGTELLDIFLSFGSEIRCFGFGLRGAIDHLERNIGGK